MKKILTGIIAAAMSLAATAQTDVWVWQNGTATKMAAADSITFTEPQAVTPETPTHEYVDLGLSVKWATCNVGAEKPEDYGDYFAWGETEKTTLIYGDAWDEYRFCELIGYTDDGEIYNNCDVTGNGTVYVFSKYNSTDGKRVLDAEDDAAAVNWGGAWRMPTVDELKELYENCTWEYKEDFNGVSGYKVTSKKTGYTDKYIFLPLAGFISSYRGDAYNDGVEVKLWSSSLWWSSLVPNANAYNLRGKKDGSYEVENSSRSDAYSVRPVCK